MPKAKNSQQKVSETIDNLISQSSVLNILKERPDDAMSEIKTIVKEIFKRATIDDADSSEKERLAAAYKDKYEKKKDSADKHLYAGAYWLVCTTLELQLDDAFFGLPVNTSDATDKFCRSLVEAVEQQASDSSSSIPEEEEKVEEDEVEDEQEQALSEEEQALLTQITDSFTGGDLKDWIAGINEEWEEKLVDSLVLHFFKDQSAWDTHKKQACGIISYEMRNSLYTKICSLLNKFEGQLESEVDWGDVSCALKCCVFKTLAGRQSLSNDQGVKSRLAVQKITEGKPFPETHPESIEMEKHIERFYEYAEGLGLLNHNSADLSDRARLGEQSEPGAESELAQGGGQEELQVARSTSPVVGGVAAGRAGLQIDSDTSTSRAANNGSNGVGQPETGQQGQENIDPDVAVIGGQAGSSSFTGDNGGDPSIPLLESKAPGSSSSTKRNWAALTLVCMSIMGVGFAVGLRKRGNESHVPTSPPTPGPVPEGPIKKEYKLPLGIKASGKGEGTGNSYVQSITFPWEATCTASAYAELDTSSDRTSSYIETNCLGAGAGKTIHPVGSIQKLPQIGAWKLNVSKPGHPTVELSFDIGETEAERYCQQNRDFQNLGDSIIESNKPMLQFTPGPQVKSAGQPVNASSGDTFIAGLTQGFCQVPKMLLQSIGVFADRNTQAASVALRGATVEEEEAQTPVATA